MGVLCPGRRRHRVWGVPPRSHPLISSIFAPLLGEGRTAGPLGRTIDVFAIIVTLFGTAASLGLGALQIGHGVELVSGIGELGNGVLIAVIALLTACFIASAVSGVSKGIRALSNINAVMALVLAFFVFFVGPTMLILNIIPPSRCSSSAICRR